MTRSAIAVAPLRIVATLAMLAIGAQGDAAANAASQTPTTDIMPADMSQRCNALTGSSIDGGQITSAQWVSAGQLQLPSVPSVPGVERLPAFCRVSAVLKPVPQSNIEIEVWLPASDWNGRFQGVGNGGFGGSISYPALAEALLSGYATASTDTGHKGTMISGEWAMGQPERVKDFGFRAVHEMTVSAKQILSNFYRQPARFSYWNGCSEGGNQALSEAQRFPGDYNGILAGAPANYMTHLQAGGNWISQALHKDRASFLPESKLQLINDAVIAACDAQDGVRDHILEDPRKCAFDLEELECNGADADNCLTEAQIRGIELVYDGVKPQPMVLPARKKPVAHGKKGRHNTKAKTAALPPRVGKQIFPGHVRGSELGWAHWIAGTDVPPTNLQHLIQNDFFRYLVFDNERWDWKTLRFDHDVDFADEKLGAIVNQTDPDLRTFRSRGGKLIQYHGWYDPAISPLNSVNYFQSVHAKMGDTQDFYRLFMVPGMDHCQGGPGATEFDKMSLLTMWVEKNEAPTQIVATRTAGGQVVRTHLVCAYPQTAHYKGTGNMDDAANFDCE